MSQEYKRGDIDIRSQSERSDWTETVCDCCGYPILESEKRHPVEHEEIEIVCDACMYGQDDDAGERWMRAG